MLSVVRRGSGFVVRRGSALLPPSRTSVARAVAPLVAETADAAALGAAALSVPPVVSIPPAFLVPPVISMPAVDIEWPFHVAEAPLGGGVDLGVLLLQTGTSLFASCFGFGDAVLAMPLMALLFGLDARQAAPLVTTVSTSLQALILSVDYLDGKIERVGRWKESLALVGAAAVGVPLGVQLLLAVRPSDIRAVVGALLVAYGAWALLAASDGAAGGDGTAHAAPPPVRAPPDDAAAADAAGWPPLIIVPLGLVAGLCGGAVAEPGRPRSSTAACAAGRRARRARCSRASSCRCSASRSPTSRSRASGP